MNIGKFIRKIRWFFCFFWRPGYADDRLPGESRILWWLKWRIHATTAWRVARVMTGDYYA